jgi:hypothetical protein
VGLLRRQYKPFVANCEAARVLSRVAVASGDPVFLDAARSALDAAGSAAAAHGPAAAHYVLAVQDVDGG